MSDKKLGKLFQKFDEHKTNVRQVPELLSRNHVLTNGSGPSHNAYSEVMSTVPKSTFSKIPALHPIQRPNTIKWPANYFNGTSSNHVDYQTNFNSQHQSFMNGRYIPNNDIGIPSLIEHKPTQRSVPSLAPVQSFGANAHLRSSYFKPSMDSHKSRVNIPTYIFIL